MANALQIPANEPHRAVAAVDAVVALLFGADAVLAATFDGRLKAVSTLPSLISKPALPGNGLKLTGFNGFRGE